MAILSHLLPVPLRADLTPVLHRLEEQLHPRGLWLFGSWARGQQSRLSDIDPLIMGVGGVWADAIPLLEGCRFP